MKNMSLSDFMGLLPSALTGVTDNGDVLRVQTKDHGTFVVMPEGEYQILSNALRAVFAVAGSVNADEKTIDVESLLSKLDG